MSQQRLIAVGERANQLRVKMIRPLAHLRRHALFVQHAGAPDLGAEARREIALTSAGSLMGVVPPVLPAAEPGFP